VATAPGRHPRGQGPGHVHVGEHVDGEGPLPVAVVAEVVAEGHPGVGAPQVDRPELLLDPVHQPGHGRRVGHVQPGPQRRRAAEAGGHPLGPLAVQVGHDHRPGPLGREPFGQGPADPPRPAGDDRDRSL
jgi:hypothetical protein